MIGIIYRRNFVTDHGTTVLEHNSNYSVLNKFLQHFQICYLIINLILIKSDGTQHIACKEDTQNPDDYYTLEDTPAYPMLRKELPS